MRSSMPIPKAKVTRESKEKALLVKMNDDEILEREASFLNRHHVNGIIRIHHQEIVNLLPSQTKLTHFNLEISHHKPGLSYGLATILKPGFYKQCGEEQLPLLARQCTVQATCYEVLEQVAYTELTDEDFTHSFAHIKTVSELQNVILQRYTQSLPDLSPEKILSLGVAITRLQNISPCTDTAAE